MAKSVKYRIIFSDVARIAGEVNRAMDEGWQPQGGAFVYTHPDGSQFGCQTMVSAKKRDVVAKRLLYLAREMVESVQRLKSGGVSALIASDVVI